MFLYDNLNNLTIKLCKSYNSLYKRIRNSHNSLIVQLYYYKSLVPFANYLPYGINRYLEPNLDFVFVKLLFVLIILYSMDL